MDDGLCSKTNRVIVCVFIHLQGHVLPPHSRLRLHRRLCRATWITQYDESLSEKERIGITTV